MTAPKPMLEGTLGGGTSLADVLSALSTSRQWLEVVLEDEARILCKSGQLLDAFAPPDRSGVEAFHSLLHQPGGAYSVYRRDAPEEGGEPLGALCKLISLPPPQPVVLEGSFAQFRIRDVLEVLSIGRQTLQLVATRADGAQIELVTRAGRLLSCTGPDQSGVPALRALLEDPGERFLVTRGEAVDIEPLGSLADLLAEPAAEETRRATPVLQGRFDTTPITELLEVVGLSRQLMEIALSRDGEAIGQLLVKSGCIVSAWRGGKHGREAFGAILRDPGTTFRVTRSKAEVPGEPLGTIASWLQEARPPEPRGLRQLVLEGRFAGVRATEVLSSVALSRQHLVVLFRSRGKARGRVALKAGRVLEAALGTVRGWDAVQHLLDDPGESYVVYRMPAGTPLPEPIGTVEALLAEDHGQITELVLPEPELPEAPVELEDRLRELSTAIASLERAIAAQQHDRAWTGLAAVQALTLVVAVLLLAQCLLGG